MIYQVRFLKGLLHPKDFLYQLEKAEEIRGFKVRVLWLFLASALIFSISALLGIGTETISRELTGLSASDFETRKLLFLLGQFLWGLFFPAIMLLIPAAFFWTLTDIPFKKIFVVQMFAVLVLLTEKAILLPLILQFGLDKSSSPFSLGVIAQYLTNYSLIVSFFSQISIFSLFALYLQYKGLRYLSDRKPGMILSMVIALNVLFWMISSFLSFIKFEKLL